MLSTNSVIEEISKLQCVKRMRASVNTAIKYGTMVGAITITSGILGGPVGLAVGGMISSCALGFMSQGELKSVPDILLYDTTPEQREKLAKLIMQLVKSKPTTICDFIYDIGNDTQLQQTIIQVLTAFLFAELGVKVQV
nr:protein C19orf12 homolog [Osmia lignaria]